MNSDNINKNQNVTIRLDKWLWAARFYKTRTIAREMINGGKVHYNGQKAKPSKIIELGAKVSLRRGYDEKTVIIEKLSDQRKGASEAVLLYSETQQSIELRAQKSLERKMQAHNPSPERRPDKKQRRDIIRFKDKNN